MMPSTVVAKLAMLLNIGQKFESLIVKKKRSETSEVVGHIRLMWNHWANTKLETNKAVVDEF